MASGEMSREAFTTFLIETLGIAAKTSVDGAVHFVCMDWRHISELVIVSRDVYGTMLNLITWVKTNAGQGSFYRSQHELIGVFRVGSSPHLNTIELGRHGRSRSNVWRYAGANTFRAGRMEDLGAASRHASFSRLAGVRLGQRGPYPEWPVVWGGAWAGL